MGTLSLINQKSITHPTINNVIEDYKYVYKQQHVHAGDFVNYINGLAQRNDYGNSQEFYLNHDYSGMKMSATPLTEQQFILFHQGNYSGINATVCQINGGEILEGKNVLICENDPRCIDNFYSVKMADDTVAVLHPSGTYLALTIVKIVNNVAQLKKTFISSINITPTGTMAIKFLSNNRFLIVYRYNYNAYCTIWKLQDEEIIYGEPIALSSSTTAPMLHGVDSISIEYFSDDKVYIIYTTIARTLGIEIQHLILEDMTITKTSNVAPAERTGMGGKSASVKLDDNHFFLAFSVGGRTSMSATTINASIWEIKEDGSFTGSGGGFPASSGIICSTQGSGENFHAILVDKNTVAILYQYGDKLYTKICIIDGTTITCGPEKALEKTSYTQYSLLLFQTLLGQINIFYANTTKGNVAAGQAYTYDRELQMLTERIVLLQYEEQVQPATEPPFDAIALSDGVGSAETELEEVYKTQTNPFASGWTQISPVEYHHESGAILTSSWAPTEGELPMIFDNDATMVAVLNAVNPETQEGLVEIILQLTEPLKIEKFSPPSFYFLEDPHYTVLDKSVGIQLMGSKDNQNWELLHEKMQIGGNTDPEIVVENPKYYYYYKITINKANNDYRLVLRDWYPINYYYKAEMPSQGHKQQVKIIKLQAEEAQ